MSKLSTRIERLEGDNAPDKEWPAIIFLVAQRADHADSQEDAPDVALFVNCSVSSIARAEGETSESFYARAESVFEEHRRPAQ
ncbi:hypothetical protein ROJ8625_03780 [Roseivivax jejudonensis]|uniref:Uncharacterized protein n=1 Tax=Roseivivax jejudonensis TaxID=1529041 RepID=A0A1X7A6X1_9RHOB|nr:hypothetical protein [Roseivivax jejudonensis]SLN72036.1 hypothetical protein ROJ8625_03780 [Roseivivax jejudonensis]